MLRAPGDLRPLKPGPARPSASSRIPQVHQEPGARPSAIRPQPAHYPGNSARGAPDVVARAAAGGRGRLRAGAAPREARWHHRDVAGPRRTDGERGRPGPRTTPLPASSLPAPLLSALGLRAGSGGGGSGCPRGWSARGCDSGRRSPPPRIEVCLTAAMILQLLVHLNQAQKKSSLILRIHDENIFGEESSMAQESPKNSAAEIPVTSNGEVDDSREHGFNRDLKRSLPAGLGLSETQITSHGFDSTKEGVIEAGALQGVQRTQTKSGPVILADEVKNPAMEKLELVRKWSLNTYKCTRQIISEKLGRGSRTVDLELEAQIDILRDNKKKYENILRLAQTLSTQLFQMVHTQRQLGDAFADLSLKSLELHEEFGYNADTQKLLAKNGETLLGAINFFIASVNTLVNKTIEDTLMTVKQYESARIEYDAYRTDLEELNLGPRDANTLPKIEQSQHLFQAHKEKYDKMRNDVSIKLKFLEENKVKVLHNQLVLFHNAIAAYFAGNQKQLEQTLKQFHIKLKTPGVDAPSWLEEQ
uniref:ADP ribosylation factor interacting protein 1 n=3 Tax=Canidae TaxID=9608 RepID=A0A8P0NV82_CANLF